MFAVVIVAGSMFGYRQVFAAAQAQVTLTASQATDYMISEDPSFQGAEWQAFVDDDGQTTIGADGQAVQSMTVLWTFATESEVGVVYVKYRSSTGEVSPIYTKSVSLLAEAQMCTPVDPPTTPNVSQQLIAGDLVRSVTDNTIYYVGGAGTIYPFPDLQTYLTYADACGTFTYTDGSVLAQAVIGPPMLPKGGTVLVKLPEDSKVYAIEDRANDPQTKLLHWIPNEEVAVSNFGQDWDDYVIEVLPEQIPYFEIGSDASASDGTEASQLRSRAALNNAVTYDLYIVNPTGTIRHAYSRFVEVANQGQGQYRFMYEDRGEDNDFDDVNMDIDQSGCLNLKFSVLPLEALWHHQIGVAIYYDNELKDDFILWEDSHDAVNAQTIVDVSNGYALRERVNFVVNDNADPAFKAMMTKIKGAVQAVKRFVKASFTSN